ncbi:MAG: 4'-phosphopantetheinyl transferase superfamily protein [Verrucomicrobia bacterium]|nr:4'-phosphopantetheinyl transferase superfamily protein [Verrucomicrobiota bacterium]
MHLNLYLLKLPKLETTYLSKIIPNLNYQLQNEIYRFHRTHDKWRTIISDLLTRKILSEKLGTSRDLIKIEKGPYGKPYLKGKEVEFNLSHSKDCIFFAIDASPIGVDIEFIEPLDDLENIIQICLSVGEQQTCLAKNKEEQLDYFYELWTLKESYLKAIGEGVNHFLKSFNIYNSGEKGFQIQSIDSETPWYLNRYTFDDQYKAAVCAQHRYFPDQPTIISAYDLLESL